MKVYFSHAMRGKPDHAVNSAKHGDNCTIAKDLAKRFRKEFPKLELYVPAESEPFVGAAYKKGYLDIDQILELDCIIVDQCDVVIVYVPEGDELQGGRKFEYDHAVATGKPVYIFRSFDHACGYLYGKYRRELI